uniref:[histone H3]-trimethyl-L-lysine(9) demethylase n=1 Tax=Knipowitschia caucasica TaxID=637954 RepID=A0AAV2JTB0_KNICA
METPASCQSARDCDIVVVTDTFTDKAHTGVSHDVAEEDSYCKSLVKRRQRQMGLPSLPPSHPLFAEVLPDINLPRKTNEQWAVPLAELWQYRPENQTAEREFNQRMSQQPPHCSVCLLFYTHHQAECDGDLSLVTRGNCQWSKPLIPEMCFNTQSSKGGDGTEGQLSNPYIAEDGTSRLVTCKRCCVRVHTSCYGVSEDDEDLGDWQCSRCKDKAMAQDCCLCSLRGGALQRANNDKWVHVLCAITVLEARFVNIIQRRPIDLSAIPLSRFRLKCALCRTRMSGDAHGCCVQCSHGRCSTAFHPTCAQAAGILMHPDDWPFIVFITCQRHRTPTAPERNKMAEKDLKVGQKVICKHKNGRYYHSEVSALTTDTFYEVVFDDGSYSDNLLPEDIMDRDCVAMGPPSEGEPVQVRWTDGLSYGAKFISAHSDPMFMVLGTRPGSGAGDQAWVRCWGPGLGQVLGTRPGSGAGDQAWVRCWGPGLGQVLGTKPGSGAGDQAWVRCWGPGLGQVLGTRSGSGAGDQVWVRCWGPGLGQVLGTKPGSGAGDQARVRCWGPGLGQVLGTRPGSGAGDQAWVRCWGPGLGQVLGTRPGSGAGDPGPGQVLGTKPGSGAGDQVWVRCWGPGLGQVLGTRPGSGAGDQAWVRCWGPGPGQVLGTKPGVTHRPPYAETCPGLTPSLRPPALRHLMDARCQVESAAVMDEAAAEAPRKSNAASITFTARLLNCNVQ